MNTEALNLMGLDVRDLEGVKIGEVTDFFFDAPTGEPEWVVVSSGIEEEDPVLVPMDSLTRDSGGLQAPYNKADVMEAPGFEGTAIDYKTERALYSYYHVRRELPERTHGQPAFEQESRDPPEFRLRSWKAS
jgi:hypothetical protein